MRKFFFLLMAMTTIVACQKDMNEVAGSVQNDESATENPYAISQEEAIANLEAFMNDNNTRSDDKREVSSIIPIKFHETRSSDENLNCENLLYVANFEDEKGYAILAADSRIDEPILAITDQGSLSEEVVYSTLSNNEDRVIFNEFPLTGPEFFTTPSTGSEVFMNPNTIELYDETENDTLVGNFDTSTLDAEGEPFGPLNDATTPEIITTSLCVDYATNQVRSVIDPPTIPLPIPPTDDVIDDGLPTTSNVTYTDWAVTQSISPILADYVDWHQSSPFNDLYPYRLKYLIIGKYKRAPAGCFPLAIAKIMTHFEYPADFSYDGYDVVWSSLKGAYFTSEGYDSIAALLRGISSGCNCLYFYNGTFCFPKCAVNFMEDEGYDNVAMVDYNFTSVKSMLDNNKPTIICSIPNINIVKSHSWNIDGYKIKKRTKTTEIYKGGELISQKTEEETSQMVHCDFGWKGACNGYYVSGLFKLGDDSVERDEGTSHNQTTNYNNYLKLMIYNI